MPPMSGPSLARGKRAALTMTALASVLGNPHDATQQAA
jgi:hypothetical protein